MSPLPIEYSAILRGNNGQEFPVDLDSAGWRNRQDVRDAAIFTLQPKPGADLPVVAVHLGPLPDGTPRELVYFSRVFGEVGMTAPGTMSPPEAQTDLFRLYCVGWKALVGGCEVEVRQWAYPGGSVVLSHEPPYVQDLMSHFRYKDLPHVPLEDATGYPA